MIFLSEYIKWFHEINKSDIPLVGGKGANLGELTQNGVNVPPGFFVTSSAYKKFISIANLDEKIKEIINSLDVEDSAQLQLKSKEVRDLIISCKVPEEIRKNIEESYIKFGETIGIKDPSVAIRSSATAEDLPEASFAGQQDTYLEIKGIDEVVSHVKKCWASLWTARAIYYRERQGFNHFEVSLSVVVQKMVNSEKSGVMFTANPVNNNTNEIMINASWGLGKQLYQCCPPDSI